MHLDSSGDLFLLWLSEITKDTSKRNEKQIAWQQGFAKRLKRGSALSRDWNALTKAGCNPAVLNALLWEVTSSGQRIISDYRERVNALKRDEKKLATLSASMKRTSAEIAQHLKLLNQLYGGVLEQRRRLLLYGPDTNPVLKPLETHNPNECKSTVPNPFAALNDPAYLAGQLSVWAESLSDLLSARKRPANRRTHDALMFMAILNYVSQFGRKLPFSVLSRLLNAALQEANRRDSITPDQLRMLWNHNRQVSKRRER